MHRQEKPPTFLETTLFLHVQQAEQKDKNRVTDILSSSFQGNQSVNYIIPQDRHRLRRIRALMEYSFEICRLNGNIWLSDDGSACALALYPDENKGSWRSFLLNIQFIVRCTGLSMLRKTLSREALIRSIRPRGRICYLWFIGVDPVLQGSGRGSRLLGEVLKESDRLLRPVYLETSVPENIGWYEGLGFSVYHVDNTMGYPLFFLKRVTTEAASLTKTS